LDPTIPIDVRPRGRNATIEEDQSKKHKTLKEQDQSKKHKTYKQQ
jgi:hypothetical protein